MARVAQPQTQNPTKSIKINPKPAKSTNINNKSSNKLQNRLNPQSICHFLFCGSSLGNQYFVYTNGHHKQYPSGQHTLTTFFILDFQEHVSIKVRKVNLAELAPERCICMTCIKTCSWQSEMKNVVKCEAAHPVPQTLDPSLATLQ